MAQKTRLLGIDLCRGFASYAVILVHSGDETWGVPVDPQATSFRLLFYFAVPFFLAVSFYFMVSKPENGASLKFWRSRIERLLVPYAIWSAIFFIFRIIVFSLAQKQERVKELIQDPLSIVFFGGASYHLYFLPLLFAGTLLMLMAPYLSKRIGIGWLSIAAVLSLVLYGWIEISGNAFQLGPDIAFAELFDTLKLDPKQYPLMRLIAVEIAWILKCLPYFLIAMLLSRLPGIDAKRFNSIPALILIFAAFFASNAFGSAVFPEALKEVLSAYFLLFFSILLSYRLKMSSAIVNLGLCSFGIYLIHPLVMNVVKPVITRLLPQLHSHISISSMLAISVSSFLISWLFVSCLIRDRRAAKFLFGV